MRISAKSRYALAAMTSMAERYSDNEYITVISISEKLGISKIYLEQVFSLLKRGGLVISTKGAQGGYHLSRMPRQITVYEILAAVELALFEPTEETVPEKAPAIEAAMRLSVFDVLDATVQKALQDITLYHLVDGAEKYMMEHVLMYHL